MSEFEIIGYIAAIIVIGLLFPLLKPYLLKAYNFLIKHLGKETINILKNVLVAVCKILYKHKDKLINKALKNKALKGKVDKEDIKDLEEGFKKGKDDLK